MQRYFVSKSQMTDSEVTITGEDVKHIVKVMRMDIGDLIICSNNAGRAVICEIKVISPDTVHALITDELNTNPEIPVSITIAQALPKGDKIDYVIQKGTELGCAQFILFQGDRSVVKWDSKKADKKLERFCKIAKEAAEQSHRNLIPEVKSVKSVKDIIAEKSNFTKMIFAYEEKGKQNQHDGLRHALNELQAGDSLLVVVGPEGGLSTNEVEILEDNHFTACSLGPRILRTETASQYVLAAISYHFEL